MNTGYQQAVRLSTDLGLGLSNGQVDRLADHLVATDVRGKFPSGTEARRLAGLGGPTVQRLLVRDPLDRAIDRLCR